MTANQQAKEGAVEQAADPLYERMICPACAFPGDGGHEFPLQVNAWYLACPGCEKRYPVIRVEEQDLPWAFPCPDTAHLEWSARYRGEVQRITEDHNRLNHALSGSGGSDRGRRRLSLELRALRDHRNRLDELLSPISLDSEDVVPAITRNLRDKLPGNQGIASYTNNVFRDWSWNNGENEENLQAVESVLAPELSANPGAVLTLGAGAGRLTYDVHRRFDPALSVALDINPLLVLMGSRVTRGGTVPAYEFPLVPIDEANVAVLQECAAPEAITDDSLRFVLGDATSAPFAPQSFDIVMTPWLIDILPHDLRLFMPQVNRLLPQNGLWVNTGTLAFLNADPGRRYSEAEVLEQAESAGFEVLAVDHRVLPYLNSPHSGHGRTERVVTFVARKVRNVEIEMRRGHLPAWAQDASLPIPSTATTTLKASSQLLKAQVLAAIDGKRSIDAIAQLVAREYGLTQDECRLAIQRMLAIEYEKDLNSIVSW